MQKLTLNFNILFLIGIMLFTFGCNDKSSNSPATNPKTNPASEYKVTGVNDFELLFNATDAGGLITFNSDTIEHCNLSFIKSKFIQGYTTRTVKLAAGDIDIDCLSNNDHFSLDDSGSTYAEMTVTELTDKAVITLNFSLSSSSSKTVLTRKNVLLTVNMQQLKTMHIK